MRWIVWALAAGIALPAVRASAEPSEERRTGPVIDYSGKDLDASFHYYVDERGRFHFTNRPELVPPRYRAIPITLFVPLPERR